LKGSYNLNKLLNYSNCGVKTLNLKGSYNSVVRSGYEFTIFTYKDLALREIQFRWMESNLTQAVGRARLINEKRKVVILSKLPFPQAEIIMDLKQEEIPNYLETKVHLTGSIIPSPINEQQVFYKELDEFVRIESNSKNYYYEIVSRSV